MASGGFIALVVDPIALCSDWRGNHAGAAHAELVIGPCSGMV